MVTDSEHGHTLSSTTGLLARVGGQVRQFICGLHGHDELLHFEQHRMSLLCTSCGHETPGWDVKGTPPRRETPAPKRRVLSMPTVRVRRAA